MRNFKSIIVLSALLLSIEISSGQICESSHYHLSSSGEESEKMGQLYACPRCRRATPPGPRKRPADPVPANIV